MAPPRLGNRSPSYSINSLASVIMMLLFCSAAWNIFSLNLLLRRSGLRDNSFQVALLVSKFNHPEGNSNSSYQISTTTTSSSPSEPSFKLEKLQTLCNLLDFRVNCNTNVREKVKVPSFPMFAEYYLDDKGHKIAKQESLTPSRPMATHWFRPDSNRVCGEHNAAKELCANLGDELGPMLLLLLSGKDFIERRYDGMDVAVIGSVLNFMVANYERSVKRVGSHYNVIVWGTGTKWGNPGVCFDFRAVRGPKTRDAYIDQGCNVPEVYGDPALLFPFLYQPSKLKLPPVDLCLIPHMDDLYSSFPWWQERNGASLTHRFSYLDHQTMNTMNNSMEAVRVIDIRTPNAAAFIDLLVSCKLVASASLHGLILAEAYNVTWSWVRLRDKHEAAFKYHDFFLSVGIDPTKTNPLYVHAGIDVGAIIDHTIIPKERGPSLYDPIKLLHACPFCDARIVEDVEVSIRGKSNPINDRT